jgi:hypothetical protein
MGGVIVLKKSSNVITVILVAAILLIAQQCFAQRLQKSQDTDMSGDHSFSIVGGKPGTVEIGHLNNTKNLDFGKPWRNKYPKADNYARYSFKGQKQLSGGGKRFIFQFLIQNGCRACEPLGSAYVAYDFDVSGRFLGTKIMKYTKETEYRR